MHDDWKERAKEHLSNPTLGSLSEVAYKVRRDLMFVSFATIILSLFQSHIKSNKIDLLIIKLEFYDITQTEFVLFFVLICILTYKFFYFFYLIVEFWNYQKLRISGSFKGASALMFEDISEEKPKMTLYYWWAFSRHKIESSLIAFNDIYDFHDRFRRLEDRISINGVNEKLKVDELKNMFKKVEDFSENLDYIFCSLKRFDDGFNEYFRRQIFRIKFFDVGIPFFVSSLALTLGILSVVNRLFYLS